MTRVKDMIAYMGHPGTRIMYGSDWPLVEMAPYVKFLKGLDFPKEARENIAWKAAAELFKIDLSRLEG